MNTLRLKSILATLIMTLVSGGVWAKTYEGYTFYYSGNYTSESHEWSFKIEAGSVITFDWGVSGEENELSVVIVTPDNNYETLMASCYDSSGTVSYVCTSSGNYNVSATYCNNGTFYGGNSNAWINDISIYPPQSYKGLDYCINDNNTDAYLIGCSLAGQINIPSTIKSDDGKTYNVVGIHNEAFKNSHTITSVTIPSSVTSLGSNLFEGCTSLKSVTIPSSVTSLGSNLFEECTSLKSVTIPSSITYLPRSLFKDCTSLTSFTIPSTIKYMDLFLFEGCTSLKSVTIPSSITSLPSYMFKGCTSLTSFTIPSTITQLGSSIFEGCTSLKSVTIPSSIKSLPYHFLGGCTSLTSFTIPSTITSLEGYTFEGCTSLKSVTIPSTVTSLPDYIFKGCI